MLSRLRRKRKRRGLVLLRRVVEAEEGEGGREGRRARTLGVTLQKYIVISV